MCGRFSFAFEDWSDILDLYGIYNRDFSYSPRYNIAPGQLILAVVSDGQNRKIGLLKWGLIPSWANDPKIANRLINAKAETLLEKPSFRSLVRRKRCLILADGFFEWRKEKEKKQPLRIRVKDKKVFGMAGLYDTWISPNGEKVSTCTVITTCPNEFMASIHNRMPVIFSRDDEDIWLDRTVQDPIRLLSILQPYTASEMYAYPVSPIVGNVKIDTPECITLQT